ncbi:thioredoxin family protein [Cytobacillus purgationiresistens]|uniref:Thioredoxin-like negative regulator of GroEL n=1 Tax=Cytobacillus purgationiresistens TaxID=863449 RepID=A0ABU0AP17_9BACI|nr:thioredoxin family protein [Cytobacillus purgationiresistens]MDQ0273029.1 thioredoxin-like negative regulator of GroEL [Cytobacillus purgationiresistens]
MQEWSQEELNRIIKEDQTVLFYLYTPMCGTCQVAGKMLTITEELLPHLKIGKADLNYFPELAERWEIESVPCLIMLKDGIPIDKIYAFHSVPYLLEQIKMKQFV